MNPVLKQILGSIARHWLGAFLGLVAGKIGLSADVASAAVSQFTDDMAANMAQSFALSVPTMGASIWSRLRLILHVRLGLLMQAGMTEKEVSNVIAEAPRGARLAAIVTADPLKL
jgi:hypothetical protein